MVSNIRVEWVEICYLEIPKKQYPTHENCIGRRNISGICKVGFFELHLR